METNEQDEMVVPSSGDNRTNVIECMNNILQFLFIVLIIRSVSEPNYWVVLLCNIAVGLGLYHA
jgi:hypothetical protein